MAGPQEKAGATSNGGLRRTSTTAAAIRRGDLKISSPIPISIPGKSEKLATQPATAEIPPPVTEGSVEGSNITNDESVREDVVLKAEEIEPVENNQTPHVLRHKRSSLDIRDLGHKQERAEDPSVKKRHTTELASTFNTTHPFVPTTPRSQTSMDMRKPQKVGSLKAVLRKIFRRKSKSPTAARRQSRGHDYHRSDPGVLTTAPKETIKEEEEKESSPNSRRILSLPVKELTPINPLGSHLPFPMNVNAPQQKSPPHEYLPFDVNATPTIRQRRATLPSVILNSADVEALTAIWGDSGAHVTAVEEQRLSQMDSEKPIGIAVSSNTSSKRRSQSAGALRDLSKEHAIPSLQRRRSAEIRYWRSNAAHRSRSVSVYSTEMQERRDSLKSLSPHDPTDDSPRGRSSATTTGKEPSPSIPIEKVQLQAFDFGTLDSAPERESGHQDETYASPTFSLEDRITNLEKHHSSLESSLQRLTGRSHRQTIILENAPKGRSRERRDRSTSSSPFRSRLLNRSSSPSPNISEQPLGLDPGPEISAPAIPPSEVPHNLTFLTSPSTSNTLHHLHHGLGFAAFPPASSASETYSASQPHSSPPALSSPASTSNPQTVVHSSSPLQNSSPSQQQSSSSGGSPTQQQLAALSILLSHERAARKALEAQVGHLQTEMYELRTELGRLVAGLRGAAERAVGAHPHPHPHTAEHAYPTPDSTRILHPSHHAETGWEEREKKTLSRFSRETEGSGSMEDVGTERGSEGEGEVGSPEVFETPREESGGFVYGDVGG
ncbi:hypothetical protein M501DRAFT_993089 [Patellaria atrata CBS 101060]|uniref:Uncharacterized protein n=1 Tax=Patellaria atrata CBS 101060 TaxID=1346257 RepID=A0A9P4SAL6_9PEZI|nr:hypothetical protein M501DRAFT_993089 [Patellaria atrata CBS 101060]